MEKIVDRIVEDIIGNIKVDEKTKEEEGLEVVIVPSDEKSLTLKITSSGKVVKSILSYVTDKEGYTVDSYENSKEKPLSTITLTVEITEEIEDEDDNGYDYDDCDDYCDEFFDNCNDDCDCDCYHDEHEEIEVIYPDTTGHVWCLYAMDPTVKEGALVANPYVNRDWKIALGNSYDEVLQNQAEGIRHIESLGLEWEIVAPSVAELAKMLEMGERFIPQMKAIKEGEEAARQVSGYVFAGLDIPEEVMDKILELYKASSKINHADNYHAGM